MHGLTHIQALANKDGELTEIVGYNAETGAVWRGKIIGGGSTEDQIMWSQMEEHVL